MRYHLPLLILAVATAVAALCLIPPQSSAQRGTGGGAGGGGGRGTGGGAGEGHRGGDGGVKHFGAVGDGKADDTAAIQRAVDAGTGEIKLPRGTYRITRPIIVELDRVGFTSMTGRGAARIVMAGPGPALKFVGTHGGTADPGSVKDNVWAHQRMPLVDGVEIVGDHDEAIGIQATGTMQLTITSTNIRGVLHGIHLVERNRNVIISNCHIYENRGVGVYLDGVNLHQFNMGQCHISYNGGGGVVVRGGNVRNIHIGASDIEGNMAAEGPATANVLIDCTGGSVAEVAITGCTIQHTGNAPDSANIRMIGLDSQADTDRLREYRYGNVTIAGNVLSDVQFNIDLTGARTVAISGNTLWKGFQRNIRVVDSSHVVLGANVLDRNPRYGSSEEAACAVEFRGCHDCTISGLHLQGAQMTAAGLELENCRRMNVTNCTILDCDGGGILLKNVSRSRVSDCLVRDDREGVKKTPAIVVTGGRGNLIVDNLLGGELSIEAGTAHAAGNHDGN